MNSKVIIVNRHYPPNPGITGESAWDLAKYLIEKHQVDVEIVNIDGSDDGGGAKREPVGNLHTLHSTYKVKNKILKQLASLLDGRMLIQKAKSIDANAPIIVMTSPPLLPFWASMLLRRGKWALWSMDLFPEAFVAIGMIAEKNPLYQWFLRKTYQFAPQKLIALGRKQATFLEKQYKKTLDTTILPCGVIFHQTYESLKPFWRNDDEKIYFGYCGNLNDAHNEHFLLEFIKALNPTKHHLILALYGKKAQKIIDFAQNRSGITIVSNVPRSQLNFLDVHLVSLISKYTHLMIPSKAVSAVAAGGAILFCGSQESDNWDMLQDAAWLIREDKDLGEQISDFLKNLSTEDLAIKKQNAQRLNTDLQQNVLKAYDEIAAFVKQVP
ncbi:hypothetical protein Emtol_3149 [Emticicia oligotrophica DSM 17448]|uniref:Uncharacterized protein n=1 Tax=Emticicia oligotrophica (strain DSM 17448 / CIP 109782 / MTCC 6937 / GPTSA100-15) TaxID=929562 RepID=A0ABM5N4H2_EMTOG|nr:hypothetical protein [Emticicia oligotrophica]AFK04282.1 hypothetical protein Emtol_3149 [Emticicia oligotrophica DSM 17448]